jgi:hypothetical protein
MLEVPTEGGVMQKLVIPWGAEQVVVGNPGSGESESVHIAWVQDDEGAQGSLRVGFCFHARADAELVALRLAGRLMYSHHTWRGERLTQPHMNDTGKGCCC